MISFIVVCGLLVVSVLLVLVWPLRIASPGRPMATAIDANALVYRRQFAELEADRRDGMVTDDHFVIEQELLEERVLADLVGEAQRRGVARRTDRAGALMYVLAIGLPLVAILIYQAIGAPGAIVHAP